MPNKQSLTSNVNSVGRNLTAGAMITISTACMMSCKDKYDSHEGNLAALIMTSTVVMALTNNPRCLENPRIPTMRLVVTLTNEDR